MDNIIKRIWMVLRQDVDLPHLLNRQRQLSGSSQIERDTIKAAFKQCQM